MATVTSSMAKTLLPGFGRPLNHISNKKDLDFIGTPFPSALNPTDLKFALPLTTLREFTMLQLMNVATDKEDWNIKLRRPEIAKKWEKEALSSGLDITPQMARWCLDELRHKASLIPPGAPIPPVFVYNGDVFKSDNAVSAELKKALQEKVKEFECKIPDKSRDWHPGSDQKVWDLVHPSLYPLVYGRTRVLPDGQTTTLEDCINRCGEGEVTSIPNEKETTAPGEKWKEGTQNPFSAKFQWLPCEVDISGDQAKITSYINNLHPQEEKPLYHYISQLITASIPLWELTLAPLIQDNDFARELRINYTECVYDPDPEEWPETEGPQQESDEGDEDFGERRQKWIQDTRVVIRPEPQPFLPLRSAPKLDLRKVYGKRGLQVIVKLANIELTPDNPEYEGGSWHVEGQMNEHIVATALYYYSCDNITSSSLSFRQQLDPFSDDWNLQYLQDQFDWLEVVFGCEQDGPCAQDVGSVVTREGRLLTFPNVLQHRVGPFKLSDPTKPGHRKIVALFLVDPNIKVISTAHVPCQRKDWWIEATLEKQSIPADASPGASHSAPGQAGKLNDLPPELQDLIFKQVDFPISLKDAEMLRLELMEERKSFTIHHRETLEENTISLCEH